VGLGERIMLQYIQIKSPLTMAVLEGETKRVGRGLLYDL